MSNIAEVNQRNTTRSRSAVSATNVTVAILGVAIVAIQLFHLATLTVYPPVFIDESWNANAAWNWLQTGINFDSMHAGTLDQYGYEWLRWPTLGNAFWRLSFALFGLGLFQLRLVSWIFGSLTLIATFFVGRRSYGPVAGALAALLLALSLPYLQASHYARWDIMIAFLVMAAYGFALLGLEDDKWYAHFLAGLLIGISLDIHLNGILFAPALAALYLVVYKKQMLVKRGTWLCALGGSAGIAFFAAIKILPNSAAYFNQFQFSYSFTHKLPISELNPLDILRSLDDEIGRFHFYDNNLDFALIGASVVFLLFRHNKMDRALLIYVGVAFACFVFLVGNKHDVYAIILYPFFQLMVAATLVSLLQKGPDVQGRRAFAGALLGMLLINSVVHYVRPISANRNYDYAATAEQISSVIPTDARVMGRPEWWLGLSEYDYRSNLNLTYYHHQNGYSLTEGMQAVHPDILIVDTKWRQQLVEDDYFPSEPGFGVYNLPRAEFEDFLAQSGVLLTAFSDPYHGTVEIYAVEWN